MSSSEERARLFVALELPAAVRAALGRWRSGAVDGLGFDRSGAVGGLGFDRSGAVGGLRFIREEDLHVTLCFLGWQPLSASPPILAACEVAAGLPAARLQVSDAIWLPRRRPRVLAVALDDRAGALASVQRSLSSALAAGGRYAPEKRRFLAHVTVARVGRGGSVARGLDLGALPSGSFVGDRVTLFRSRLSPAGARYEPLGTVALAAG